MAMGAARRRLGLTAFEWGHVFRARLKGHLRARQLSDGLWGLVIAAILFLIGPVAANIRHGLSGRLGVAPDVVFAPLMALGTLWMLGILRSRKGPAGTRSAAILADAVGLLFVEALFALVLAGILAAKLGQWPPAWFDSIRLAAYFLPLYLLVTPKSERDHHA